MKHAACLKTVALCGLGLFLAACQGNESKLKTEAVACVKKWARWDPVADAFQIEHLEIRLFPAALSDADKASKVEWRGEIGAYVTHQGSGLLVRRFDAEVVNGRVRFQRDGGGFGAGRRGDSDPCTPRL